MTSTACLTFAPDAPMCWHGDACHPLGGSNDGHPCLSSALPRPMACLSCSTSDSSRRCLPRSDFRGESALFTTLMFCEDARDTSRFSVPAKGQGGGPSMHHRVGFALAMVAPWFAAASGACGSGAASSSAIDASASVDASNGGARDGSMGGVGPEASATPDGSSNGPHDGAAAIVRWTVWAGELRIQRPWTRRLRREPRELPRQPDGHGRRVSA